MHLSHLLVALCILALVSGQEQLLMVFGGLNVYDPLRNVTLLSLDGGPPVPECLQNLSPAPKLLYSACQAALGPNKLPHVCGGRYWEGNSQGLDNFANDKCYIYEPGKPNIPYTG